MLNKREIEFRERYLNTIKEYDIKITFKELITFSKNQFMEQKNSEGVSNLIEIGMERKLSELSPLFFISEYCYIELKGQPLFPAKKTLYYFQKEIIKQAFNYRKCVYTKSRQVGLSTINALMMYWKAITHKSEWVVIVSKDSQSSQEFLDKIKVNLDNIPIFLGTKVTTNNVKSLKFTNGSIIQAFARSKTATRGTSPTEVVLDECSHYQSNNIIQGIIASSNAAISRTGGRITILSTPNGNAPDSEGFWYWQQVNQLEQEGGENIKDSARLFHIDWWMVPDIPNILPHRSYNKQLETFEKRDYYNDKNVYYEARRFFDPIAKDWKNNDWLRSQYKTSGPILYRQEILRDFVVMGSTVFSQEVLDKIQENLLNPISKDMIENMPCKDLWVWKKPEIGKKYICGIDVSSGTSRDSSAIQVLDVNTLEQVAEYSGKCTTFDLAYLAEEIGYYYNTAMIFIESNSIGEATFTILNQNRSYPNLYKKKKSANGVTRFTGWETTTKSRELIVNNLIEKLYGLEDDENLGIYSERLLGQLKTWIYTQAGKPEHAGSAHDDLVLSYAIGLYNVNKAAMDTLGFFVDEAGQTVSVNSQQSDRLFNKVATANRQAYIEAEEKMLEDYGVPSLDELKWILG